MSDKDTTETWTVVASVDDVARTNLYEVHVGRQVVLLVKVGDELRAYQGLCPHQLARLSEGMLVDDAIQCPRHLARFSIDDGRCTGGWQLEPLRRYGVRIDNGDVLLSLPLKKLG